jgi:hypothetical protein
MAAQGKRLLKTSLIQLEIYLWHERERAGMKPVSKHIATVDIVTQVLRSLGHKPCPSRSENDLLLEKIASLRGFLEDCAAHEREVLDSINWNHRRP